MATPRAQLSLTAEGAAFSVGNVPGLDETPPDYTDRDLDVSDQTIGNW